MQITTQNNNISSSDNTTNNDTISEITEHKITNIKPSLTVELQQTIFNNIKLYKSPNLLKITKLISSNLINYTENKQLNKLVKKVNNKKYFRGCLFN